MLRFKHPNSAGTRMNSGRPCLYLTVFAAVMFLFSANAAADQQPLFEHDETLQVRIEAPFSTIRRVRSDEEYLEGSLQYLDSSGATRRLDLKVRARGRFRKQREICDFPPLRLNFRKKQVVDTEFHGQDKLKLVTHCESGRKNYEQDMLQEYLAYRILNTVTENSFRVRLLHVTYANTESNGKELTKYAFLIEDDDRLGERLGMQHSKVRELQYHQLEMHQTSLFTVFQYMIGNTDFSAVMGPTEKYCCHNAVLFTNPVGQFTPVPYDFDFSGIVNARYAAPGKQFKLKSVKERVYRGLCRHNNLLPGTVGRFQEQEQTVRQLISELDGFSDGTRRSTQRYIDSFYKDVSSQDQMERHFVKECSSATGPPVQSSANQK